MGVVPVRQRPRKGEMPGQILRDRILAERQEILCHKWIESEKPATTLGFERGPRRKVQSRISSRLENDPLPLLSVFIDNMHVVTFR